MTVLPKEGLRCYGILVLLMRKDYGGGGMKVDPALWNLFCSLYYTLVLDKLLLTTLDPCIGDTLTTFCAFISLTKLFCLSITGTYSECVSLYHHNPKTIPHHLWLLIHRILAVNVRHYIRVFCDSLDKDALGFGVDSGWAVGVLLLLLVEAGFHSFVSGLLGRVLLWRAFGGGLFAH